jgi:hypothetical protein
MELRPNWQAASGRALTVPVRLSTGDIVDLSRLARV